MYPYTFNTTPDKKVLRGQRLPLNIYPQISAVHRPSLALRCMGSLRFAASSIVDLRYLRK